MISVGFFLKSLPNVCLISLPCVYYPCLQIMPSILGELLPFSVCYAGPHRKLVLFKRLFHRDGHLPPTWVLTVRVIACRMQVSHSGLL